MTIRVNQEKKALEALAEAQRALETAEARLRAVRHEIDELHGARRDALKNRATSESLHQMQHGLRALKEQIVQAQADVEKEQGVVNERSQALLDARKKREIVEKLYDKKHASHSAGVARAEQRVLDDFATLKSVGGLALKWQ